MSFFCRLIVLGYNHRSGIAKVLTAAHRFLATQAGPRYILGIETSCDDTGAAILDESGTIISESLSSQLAIHLRNGGIIPPVARDLHREKIVGVVDECLLKSGLEPSQLEAIAVTNRPGLALSLLVGLQHAKLLARKWGKPIIPIHHMEAHALTIRMVEDLQFPFLVMLISGGHALLGLAEDIDRYQLFGTTIDDAPGEVLDKIARHLKLTNLPQYAKMSGGAAMDHLAQFGDPRYFEFPIPLSRERNCDFSFAGVKTKAKNWIRAEEIKHQVGPADVIPTAAHLAAASLHSIARSLAKRLERAIAYCRANNLLPEKNRKLVVSGGVACNSYIKKVLKFMCERNEFTLHVPPPKLCCDNGVMIAWNGVEKLKKNRDLTFEYGSVDIIAVTPFGVDVRRNISDAAIRVPYVNFPRKFFPSVIPADQEIKQDNLFYETSSGV